MSSLGSPKGTLYVVSTPIGNLRDITVRALDILGGVSLVVAEDTRHTRKLMEAHGIKSKLLSLHAHSKNSRLAAIMDHLLRGNDAAYVTDAGTPTVSDPGTELIDGAHLRTIPVRVIPGPSAVTSAVAISGLPCHDFRFLGFLPRGRGKRRALLRETAKDSALVVFESKTRIRGLLEIVDELVPKCRVAVCRELTKVHEEVIRGTASELLEALPDKPRGEFTLVIAPTAKPREDTPTHEELIQKASELRREGISTSEAARILSRETGSSRKEIYRLIIENEGEPV